MATKKIKKKQALDAFDITVVLDRSGSMQSIAAATIDSFNEFLSGQQAVEGKASLTLMLFDNEFHTLYESVPIKEAKPLTHLTYVPRGTTALFDAVGMSIEAAKGRPKDTRKVFCIITDGLENASHKFTRTDIFNLITAYRKDGWEFVFLGANQDAYASGEQIGIMRANSLSVTGNNIGTQSMYASVGSNLRQYRAGGQSMAFSQDDKDAQARAEAGL